MTKVAYSHRILCDKHFLIWILNQKDTRKRDLLNKMIQIKSSSLYHTKSHNVMLEENFNDSSIKDLIKKKLQNGDNIYGAIKSVPLPDFLKQEKNAIAKCVRYATYLTSEKPYKTCILTSVEIEREYRQSPHLKEMISTVIIKSEEDAASLIESFYNQFTFERSLHL